MGFSSLFLFQALGKSPSGPELREFCGSMAGAGHRAWARNAGGDGE